LGRLESKGNKEEGDVMMYWLATILIVLGTIIDLGAVYSQILKVHHCHDSSSVSTTFCFRKVFKDLLLAGGLIVFKNWAALLAAIPVAIGYILLYWIVVKNKPKEWKPTKLEKLIGGK
jgi:hypothetical protein